MRKARKAFAVLCCAVGLAATPAALHAEDWIAFVTPCQDLSASDGESLWERPRLAGDLFGLRSGLEEKGIGLHFYATQFYQGLAAGGNESDWEYGGKLDSLIDIDGQKLGLWEGLFVNLHSETRLGQSVNNLDGLLTPSNIAMSFPEAEGNVTALTGVKITQALSPNFAVYAGKINTLDEYPLRYSPALGLERPGIGGFMNTSLVFNPIMARTIPYSALGVGAAVLSEGEPVFTLTAFDPQERATIGLQDPYERGVVIMPDFVLRLKPFDLPGVYNFGGGYSTAEYRSVDPASYLFLPDIGLVGGTEDGSWAAYANFYQALWADSKDDTKSWGVFGQFGISDGNPNPIRFVANMGLSGRSMVPHRPLDTFGLGFFYLGLSENFKDLAEPILPQQDEYGTELFYNYAVTPWCRVTADLQVARPSTQGLDTPVIPGVRMSMIF
ncbi:Porin B precursor [Caulifigura coniformis]|uniref:Porin B n=1 Tax=Caulifigura coniformis TaxID=2527983 RepID=A0A517SAC3_9PLAN|nr:carbohydrate porin [Caulifigura coniformis]QDT53077.1 Porin B precursor [Caulifigura coniformis]